MSTSNVRGRLSELSPQEAVGGILLLGIVLLALDLIRLVITGELPLGRLWAYTWNGIVDSLYIGLAAIGLSMTYSILRFANFSHGDLLTTGAFSGWTVAYLVGGLGLADLGSRLLLRADGGAAPGIVGMDVLASPLAIVLGLVFAAVVTVLVALAIDRLVYRRMRDAGGIPLLIASVGVALALRYLIALFYTTDTRGVVASAPEVSVPVLPIETIDLHEATLVVSALTLILGVHLLLQYTKLGKSMRAMADNKDLALITGIPTERVIFATWVIGSGLAGVAGYLIVLDRGQITINLGWFLLLLIFAAVILGGIGSIYGALAGSLIIGLTINLSLIWIPADLNEIAAFTLMIVVLIFRPQGLFGGVETA
ncbi:branched-chain amino acid ABC transporter permease [Natronobacterium texcoconense]|uniref:Amino acid/amide ABC transporter membrane protein 1, HAAT family n=1 Tax=Natronobacterium texcoconense TaxID=1095778 RepID=A0A1H1BKT9_NATTX|nr:branched-chain amino acid ABC transporter permease [Natronobacterium texcoconense]SDQ52562.1 amino acid/amide ABC transporter membrane protein 1, HAAT family [Natronobacterium texcoconense]